ncbi:hypothetical protein G6F42_025599 [Rhizopus arrhizus]|nr:hypothetical protein G6F42_025599 [Rhizopus arrhizus]
MDVSVQFMYQNLTLETVIINDKKYRYMRHFFIQEEIYQIMDLLGLEGNIRFNRILVSRQLGFAMLACRYSYLRR